MNMVFGKCEIYHEVVVADIKSEAILGIDFLDGQDCGLDLRRQILKLKGESLDLKSEGSDSSKL